MRRSQALVVAAVALTALSACAGGSGSGSGKTEGDAKVATLTSAAPQKTEKAEKAAQRPRERLDTTPEEFEAMLGPYNKCLKERGYAPDDLKRKAVSDAAAPAVGPASEAMDEAYRVCEAQFYPLPPWEKDPANPEARDFAVAVVKCLKNKGVKYVEVAEDGLSYALGGDQNDRRSITMGMDLAPECEREVAAKN
ncbi:hypothetical protein Aab01nite_66890 [Paractinoplanes abujensis]|uniref:Lipoprotein n=1 Tax=Paractinoplanes abujensis TaxID=882441 RepID=A0A7W7G4P5_9ACTN|nr:hypothetical protein [Actinoplanes abujensis]MBB4695515.1 hypothetical protein [Actinoplanes abujensis]GID23099.1 hypothetical protein Aab01nite_66890 [Actinoplanes abujensis]